MYEGCGPTASDSCPMRSTITLTPRPSFLLNVCKRGDPSQKHTHARRTGRRQSLLSSRARTHPHLYVKHSLYHRLSLCGGCGPTAYGSCRMRSRCSLTTSPPFFRCAHERRSPHNTLTRHTRGSGRRSLYPHARTHPRPIFGTRASYHRLSLYGGCGPTA